MIQVRVSDARDPKIRREENNLFAMEKVRYAFLHVRAMHPDWDLQPCLLLALKNLVTGQEGCRDEARESEVFDLFIKHEGFGTLAAMMGANR